jgi:uncharacterized cupredoxin-like copper-binding protein
MTFSTPFNKSALMLVMALVSTTTLADGSHQGNEAGSHSAMERSMAAQTMDHSSMNMEVNSATMSDVGMPAPGVKPNKVVHVLLADDSTITFKKEVKIEPNDVVQFVVLNVGDEVHEFSIGSAREQIKHREMMKKMGNHQHDSGSAVTVQPGKAKQLTWHFHGQTEVELACNIPGHAEDGMVKHLSL